MNTHRTLAGAAIILLSLALFAGAGAAATSSAPSFSVTDLDDNGEQTDIYWTDGEAATGSQSIRVKTSTAAQDYSTVIIPGGGMTLDSGSSLHYDAYRAAGSDIPARDETFLFLDTDSDDDVDAVLWNHYGPDSDATDTWLDVNWGLNDSEQTPHNRQGWDALPIYEKQDGIENYYGAEIKYVGLAAGSTGSPVDIDVYFDNVSLNGNTILDDDSGDISTRTGSAFQSALFESSIQDNIDAALSGDTVQVEPGTYHEQVTIPEGASDIDVQSVGNAADTKIRYKPSSTSGTPAVSIAADQVSFTGFNVTRVAADARSTASNPGFTQGIRISGSSVTAADNLVHGEGLTDTLNKGIMVVDDESGGSGESVNAVTVSGGEVSGFYGGVSVTANYGGTIDDVTVQNVGVRDNDGDGLNVAKIAGSVDNIAFDGNVVTGNDYGLYVYGDADPATSNISATVTVDGNDFTDNDVQVVDNSGILDIQAVLDDNLLDRAVTIDRPSSSLLNTVWSNIQDAVNTAQPDDTIEIADGNYPQDIHITTPDVTIAGSGAGTTTLDVSSAAGHGSPSSGIYVNADGVTVADLTVTGSGGNRGIKVHDTAGVEIKDVEVTSMDSVAIDTILATDTTFDGVTVTNNDGAGFFLKNVEDVTFTGVTTSGNSWGGVGIGSDGGYSQANVTGIVFAQDNSFGETDTSSPNPAVYTEVVNGGQSISVDTSGSADVSVQDGSVAWLMDGDTSPYEQDYYYQTKEQAADAADAPWGHFDGNGYVQHIATGDLYVGSGMAIQNAIDTVGSGDTVRVGPGTYMETITLDGSVGDLEIIGETGQRTDVTVDGGIDVEGDVSGLAVADLTLTGTAGAGRTVSIGGGSLTDTVFDNVLFKGNGNAFAIYGNDFQGTFEMAGSKITGYTADDWGTIYVAASNGDIDEVIFQSNNVTDNTGMVEFHGDSSGGSTLPIVTVQNNSFHNTVQDSADQAKATLSIQDAAAATVEGNDFQNNFIQFHVGGYGDVGSLIQSVLDKNTFDQAVAIDRPANSYLHTVWSSIQDAVDEAESGDTVQVGAGTYAGVTGSPHKKTVSITTDNITLEGMDAGNRPVLDAGLRDGIVLAGADNVEIRNLVVEGYDVGLNIAYTDHIVDAAVSDAELPVEDLTVENVDLVRNSIFGMKAPRNASHTLTHHDIVLDDVNASFNDGQPTSQGVYLKAGIEGMEVRDSVFHHNAFAGINFNSLDPGSEDVVLENVTTYENGDAGIGVYSGDGVTVQRSMIGDGLHMDGVKNVVVAKNVFESTPNFGIQSVWQHGAHEPGNSTIIDNNFTQITDTAVLVGPHSQGTPEDGALQIHSNDIGVSGVGVNNTQAFTVDARRNYWGHPSGPERQAGSSNQTVGMGAAVEGDVVFTPWYPHEKMVSAVDGGTTDANGSASVSTSGSGATTRVTVQVNAGQPASVQSRSVNSPPTAGPQNRQQFVGGVDVNVTNGTDDVSASGTIKIHYDESQVGELDVEKSLKVYYYDGNGWTNKGVTSDPHPGQNYVEAEVPHFSMYAAWARPDQGGTADTSDNDVTVRYGGSDAGGDDTDGTTGEDAESEQEPIDEPGSDETDDTGQDDTDDTTGEEQDGPGLDTGESPGTGAPGLTGLVTGAGSGLLAVLLAALAALAVLEYRGVTSIRSRLR